MPRKRVGSLGGQQKKTGRSQGAKRSSGTGQGKLMFFGRHAVEAALRNPRRTIHTVYAAPRLEGFVKECRPNASFQVMTSDQIAGFAPTGAVHQDIAVHLAPLEQPALETLLDQGPRGPLLMLDQVTDPHNIGAMFRSAAAFGAGGIIMQDKNAPKETGTLARAASGALELVPWITVVNLARALETLAEAGFWSIGLSGHAEMTLEGHMENAKKLCLVLGAEGAGLRPNIEKHCDALAKLDIAPEMESLNVSNAAAVALYIAKQRLTFIKPPRKTAP